PRQDPADRSDLCAHRPRGGRAGAPGCVLAVAASAEARRPRERVGEDDANGLDAMTPPETAGVRKAYEAVGRAMVEMTTAVRDIDEWPAIPELWRRCIQE